MATNRKNAKTLVFCQMMFSSLTSVSGVLFVEFVLILRGHQKRKYSGLAYDLRSHEAEPQRLLRLALRRESGTNSTNLRGK